MGFDKTNNYCPFIIMLERMVVSYCNPSGVEVPRVLLQFHNFNLAIENDNADVFQGQDDIVRCQCFSRMVRLWDWCDRSHVPWMVIQSLFICGDSIVGWSISQQPYTLLQWDRSGAYYVWSLYRHCGEEGGKNGRNGYKVYVTGHSYNIESVRECLYTGLGVTDVYSPIFSISLTWCSCNATQEFGCITSLSTAGLGGQYSGSSGKYGTSYPSLHLQLFKKP